MKRSLPLLVLLGCAAQSPHVYVASAHLTAEQWAQRAASEQRQGHYDAFQQACEEWLADAPLDREAMLCAAQAANAIADITDSDERRDQALTHSVALLDRLQLDSPTSAPADARFDYLRSEALGLRVRSHPSHALTALGEIHQHALAAYRLDKRLYSGAPIRLLGMLLVKAPPWPQGPGDPDEGLKLLDEAIKEFPDRAEAYAHKAEALLDQSRIKEAEFWLTQALKRRHDDARTAKVVNDVADKLGRHQRVKSYQ